MKKVCALILAAGEAKRFGVPKQLLEWEDTTILGKVLKEFKKSNILNIYLVLGAYFEKITLKLKNELKGINIINNVKWQEGMFSSIKQGLSICKKNNEEYIIIHQGDMPFITSDVINKFIEKANKNNIVIATVENRPAHPYLIHKKFINEILNMDGKEGMRPFIKKYFSIAEKISVPYIVGKQDIDTWEEYRRLKNGVYME